MDKSLVEDFEKIDHDDYNGLFRLVKKIVKKLLGRERASMMLALAYLHPNIGAFHQIGTNVMVLNKLVLEGIELVSDDKNKKKAYVFSLLLHEYLHAVGIINETQVRNLVLDISLKIFGPNHLVTKFSAGNPFQIFNGLREVILQIAVNKKDNKVVFIDKFDADNANYFI
ncbi:MAG: hypothetical protein J7L07_00475 [Candidatus Odinarchaeota archaeon]|nr:hypothetical protein [Candidatus Odinarchaeota archaeon]